MLNIFDEIIRCCRKAKVKGIVYNCLGCGNIMIMDPKEDVLYCKRCRGLPSKKYTK
jgi:hypothetical protein